MKRLAPLLIAALTCAACAPESTPENSATRTSADVASPAAEESQIVLMPVPADPTVSFSVAFKTGSQDDPPGLEGLAYLTGALLEDGATTSNSYEAILEKLYPLAAGYSVRVDREQTTLTGRSHRDKLDAYVPLFTETYLQPAFSVADFNRIKSDTINYLSNELRYSSDEELAKAVLMESIFAGTPYAHPPEGTVAGLTAITLEDVRAFYRRHYTQDNVLVALGGGYDDALVARMQATVAALPAGPAPSHPDITPAAINGRHVVFVDKPGADASISFGFPLDVQRGDRDFYALWIANSWLGEHRNSASHLFQVIRELRGLNYGDYSYIEAFPEGGQRNMPPVNVPRRKQIFEVWIRTLPNEQAHFALRAAVRELTALIDNGLSAEEFELTRAFLSKYVLHFADTTSGRLGYAVDDRFYGIEGEGHLAQFARMMEQLTVEDVNAALKRHMQYDNLEIAIVTGDAAGLGAALASDAPSSIDYTAPKPPEIVAQDKEIENLSLAIAAQNIRTIDVMDAFAGK